MVMEGSLQELVLVLMERERVCANLPSFKQVLGDRCPDMYL